MEQQIIMVDSIDVQQGVKHLLSVLNRQLQKGFKQLKLFYQRANQRRQLVEMEDRVLKDIGISRSEALEEARKPFWKT